MCTIRLGELLVATNAGDHDALGHRTTLQTLTTVRATRGACTFQGFAWSYYIKTLPEMPLNRRGTRRVGVTCRSDAFLSGELL